MILEGDFEPRFLNNFDTEAKLCFANNCEKKTKSISIKFDNKN